MIVYSYSIDLRQHRVILHLKLEAGFQINRHATEALALFFWFG